MRLFEIVPGNFFSILCSGNREIYYDALMALHDLFKFELNIRVDDYLASLINILEDRIFESESEDGGDGTQETNTAHGRARIILNRLVATGWVDKEFMEGSFAEIITPRSYAIPVLKLLSGLGDNAAQEYNSLVFATFSGLKQAVSENGSHLYEAVLSAKANTEQLLYSLHTFYHGIREYMRNIVDRHDANHLLQDHFGTFMDMANRVYHPIKTLDSVYRYSLPIQSLLADILANEEFLQSMCKRAVVVKKYDDESAAHEEIIGAINYVLDSYNSDIGRLVGEIDRKQSAYIKSSTDKIQYLMTADQTIKGKLVKMLTYYAKHTGKRKRIVDVMEKNIRANRQYFFDARSLYHKNVKSRRVYREPLAVERDDAFDELAKGHLLRQLNGGYPLTKVRAFVDSMFTDGKTMIEAENIPINGDSDFIMLILAVVRRNESKTRYTVDIKDGRIERNGYLIPNMAIHKKENKAHVLG